MNCVEKVAVQSFEKEDSFASHGFGKVDSQRRVIRRGPFSGIVRIVPHAMIYCIFLRLFFWIRRSAPTEPEDHSSAGARTLRSF
mmetsp:Transcript_27083/g.78176  ORF Transcript_27083/g.78176 Transcript_27083/m.78176 type:complete len:84 (+) Transcript_27083:3115-3366(+)